MYLLAALVTVIAVTGFMGGTRLIAHGMGNGTWREPLAGALIYVAVFTIFYAAIGQLDKPEEHCGVGTTYIESGNTEWYCKADKDY